jgi:hypothetical protein
MTRNVLVTGLMLVASTLMLAGQTRASYERQLEGAVSGTIVQLVSLASADGTVGVHFDLQTKDGMINVAVAPAQFIGNNNFWFMAEEQVEIIGVRVPHGGGTMRARAVAKGSALLVLRNEDGSPKWTPAIDGTDGCGVVHPPLPRTTE